MAAALLARMGGGEDDGFGLAHQELHQVKAHVRRQMLGDLEAVSHVEVIGDVGRRVRSQIEGVNIDALATGVLAAMRTEFTGLDGLADLGGMGGEGAAAAADVDELLGLRKLGGDRAKHAGRVAERQLVERVVQERIVDQPVQAEFLADLRQARSRSPEEPVPGPLRQ